MAHNHDLLTQREIEILELIAQGFSAKEVAQSIDIAPRTVEGYVDMIRLKLQARNRTHMVTKAIAARLIRVESSTDKDAAVRADAPFLAADPKGLDKDARAGFEPGSGSLFDLHLHPLPFGQPC